MCNIRRRTDRKCANAVSYALSYVWFFLAPPLLPHALSRPRHLHWHVLPHQDGLPFLSPGWRQWPPFLHREAIHPNHRRQANYQTVDDVHIFRINSTTFYVLSALILFAGTKNSRPRLNSLSLQDEKHQLVHFYNWEPIVKVEKRKRHKPSTPEVDNRLI